MDAELGTAVSYVADLVANLRIGDVTGMSFGLRVPPDGDTWTVEEARNAFGDVVAVEVRTIHHVELIEVSAVTWPAYQETDAGLRAIYYGGHGAWSAA